jgi:hypothetical protein
VSLAITYFYVRRHRTGNLPGRAPSPAWSAWRCGALE